MATNTSGGTTTSLQNTPQAKDDAYLASEDQILYFDVMTNDLGGAAKVLWSIDNTSDDGSADLIAKDVVGCIEYSELGARISLTSDGKIKYDTTMLDSLAAGQTVTDQFTYAIRLSNGTLSWATVTVTLTGTNDAPVALDDNASGNEDSSISGSVAINDSDVDAGAVLSYAVDGAPPAGFVMDGDGNWTLDTTDDAYQHIAQGAYQDVVVSYTVTDEHGASDTATLTIRVYGVNDDPVAADDNGSGNEDSLISGSVAANNDDVDDGATLGYAINGAAPAGFVMDGDGNWSLDASDAAYQHIAQGEYEDVVVSYTVTDEHGATDTATLTVRVYGVNDDPVAADDNGSGNEDSLISGSVAANDDDDDDGAILSYAVNGAPPAGFTMDGDGNWALNASDTAYQHIAQGAYEDVVVGYTVTDEFGGSDTATLTIRVYGVNDDPVALDDNGSGNEDSTISGSVAANDDDADDGATLGYAVNGAAPAGFVMDGDGNWSLDATDAAYQHIAQGAYEDVVVSYTVTDEFGGSDTATLTIRVYGANDDPVALDDNGSGNEDSTISGSVAANDDDVDDGATLGYAINGAAPAGFVMDGGGNWTLDTTNAAYQHIAQGAYQDVVISYTVTDEHGASDTATLTIRVYGVNDDPVAADDNGSGNEDSLISGSVAINDDDDDDGATLSYAVNGADPAGFDMDGDGNWSLDATDAAYQHIAQGEYEDVVVSYTVTDEFGSSDTATLTVRVYGVNDDPVAGDDSGSGNEDSLISGSVAANDDDADDGHVLSYAVNGAPPAGFTMDGDGNWALDASDTAYQHIAQGAYEDVVVGYTVTDEHGASDIATLTVRVYGVNDDPVAGEDNGGGNEDSLISGSVAANDDDVDDGAVLSYVVNGAAPAGFNMDGDGHWSLDASNAAYQHIAAGASENVVVSYTVTDQHGASDIATLTITVHGVNDDPELTGAQATLAGGTEDVDYIVSAADLLAGFTDVDGDTLDVSLLSADHGTVSDNGDGTYTIAPTANYNGTVTLSYNVVDGNGGSVPATLSFNLAAVNDPAVISGDTSGTVVEATPANPGTPTATGTLFAADVDNPPNTFIAVGSTATASGYGSFTMTAGGLWTYTLNNGNAAVDALATGGSLVDTFSVQSADGTVQTITVTIQGATDVVVVTPPATFNGTGDPNDHDGLSGGTLVAGNFTGTSSGETITGGAADQAFNMNDGNDTAYGAGGNDIITGGNGNDNLYGQAGNDQLFGQSGVDELYGGSGNDQLDGGDNNDLKLYGGSGDDIIVAGTGNDNLFGGYGADTLTGGAGNDNFIYLDLKDTNDTITDFMASGNDQIDVSAIDAIAGGANDAFGWGGTTATANSLWFSYNAGTNTTTLFGDTDGNVATAELMIILSGFSGFSLVPPPDITF